ncbi:MAG: ABC transporter permease [Bacteroidota bacterium]
MKKYTAALWAESLKVRKSGIFIATVFVFTLIPLMLGLIMYIAANPSIADKLGIIGTKAELFGASNWIGYILLLNQTIAVIGLIGFGFVTTWVFGREHSDRTLKDILALPVPRGTIVMAKLTVTALWCMVLAIVLYLAAFLLGKGIGIPGWSAALWKNFTYGYFTAVLLTLLLSTPVAWITGLSRGLIAPLGFVILTMIIGQFTAVIGLGPYFPWTVPGLFASGASGPGMQTGIVSYTLLGLTFAAGLFLTLVWWQKADHH